MTKTRAKEATSAGAADEPITEAARAALAEAGGDARRATDLMAEHARRDTGLYEALTGPLLSGACYDAIRRQCQRERRTIWTAPNYDKSGNGARVVDLAKGNSESLLDFRLPIAGLPRLGDVTRDLVMEAAEYYRSRAADMHVKARWLDLVAQSVSGRKLVKNALSDARLRELQAEVERGDV